MGETISAVRGLLELFPRRHPSRLSLGVEADDYVAGSNRCGMQVLDGLFRLRCPRGLGCTLGVGPL